MRARRSSFPAGLGGQGPGRRFRRGRRGSLHNALHAPTYPYGNRRLYCRYFTCSITGIDPSSASPSLPIERFLLNPPNAEPSGGLHYVAQRRKRHSPLLRPCFAYAVSTVAVVSLRAVSAPQGIRLRVSTVGYGGLSEDSLPGDCSIKSTLIKKGRAPFGSAAPLTVHLVSRVTVTLSWLSSSPSFSGLCVSPPGRPTHNR